MATKADKKMEAKLKARQNAKVRPDEPVEETRIYLNMPKKKKRVKKSNGGLVFNIRGQGRVMSDRLR